MTAFPLALMLSVGSPLAVLLKVVAALHWLVAAV